MTNYDKQNRQIERLKRERDDVKRERDEAVVEYKRLYSILDGIMHETRRLNSIISSACESISASIDAKNYSEASRHAENAFYSSGLISSRLTFADFEINPASISRQQKHSSGVYKKFDKARMILARSAKKRSVQITIQGHSQNKIDVLPAFEIVPFVLLDNAVKYSPDGQGVNICVADNPLPGIWIQVIITSIGPLVPTEELPKLVYRGYRGSCASKSNIPGEGIGLYLADALIRLSNGSIELSSSQNTQYSINDIAYSNFIVTINFKK